MFLRVIVVVVVLLGESNTSVTGGEMERPTEFAFTRDIKP